MGVSCLSFCATIIIHVHVLQCMYCSSLAIDVTRSFIETPSPVTIEVVEMDAVFRCRHQHIEADISWRMNGTSSKRYPDVVDSFILDSNGTRIETLTIPAIPEYNGTEVVCVATIFDESLRREVTPPADLIIMVTHKAATQPLPITTIELVTKEATTQPPSPTTMKPVTRKAATQPPPTTTLEPAITQPPPTTTMEPGFTMPPSSFNKTVEQGEAVFRCQHRSSDYIAWRVNGTSISSSDKLNISEWRVPVGDGRFEYFLSIATLPGFNNTTIECGAVFFDGSPLLFTPPVTLLIQGIPGNVSNLGLERNYSSDVLTTFWDPLPTIDITDRDPDIIYRVQVFKTTCGQSVLMSDENVTESITSNSLSLMEIYTAVITPRNNVSGYIAGPKEEMKEEFMLLKRMTLFDLSRGQSETIKSIQPVPRYYTMVLESLDGIGSNLQINISVQRDGEMVTMQIEEQLPSKCLWNASILPYNCEADMQVAELSTHEIQNIVVAVNPSYPGAIQLKGDFIDGSEATGVLWMVYSLNNDSDIQYIYIAKQPEQSSISMDVTGLTGTEYGVSSFPLENGVPFLRVVTLPTNIIISVADNDDRETMTQPIEYYVLHPTSTGICITCTFLENSATDCVAVVHQRISQLNSSGLMNIESSHKFTRSGDTAYGCIEGVNLEQYQVGVVGGKMISPPTIQTTGHGSSQSGAVVGIVLAIIAFILIAVMVIGIIILYYLRRTRQKVIELGPLYSEVGIAPPHLQSDTVVNIEDDSGFHHYVESAVPLREEETEGDTSAEEQSSPLPPGLEESLAPPLPPRSEESMILVEDQLLDLARSPLDTIKESDRLPPPPPPPPPPRGPPDQDTSKDKDGSSDPTYAQPELTNKVAVPPPAATERLVYDDIHGFQNKEGQTYALTQLPPSKKVVDDLHKVMYSEIQPKTGGEVTRTEPDCTAEQTCETGTPPPPRDISTTDLFFSRLLPYASKWQSLGEALSLGEDRLDEIFTNNEREEDCLQEMLELYMMRSDRNHSWEEIEAALERIANGIQESDSSRISPMIDGSTTFSSDVHANTQDRSPSHIVDICEARCIPETDVTLGAYRRWSLRVKSAAEEIHSGVDYDFKSEPNLPHSHSSFTFDDNPQCTLSWNLKEDRVAPPATDVDDINRRERFVPSSPSFLGGHRCNSYVGSFIINKGYEEELFDTGLQLCVPQESYMEVPDYNRVLIKQLGLGRQNPSSRNHCQESSEEFNMDVHAGSSLATSSSQGVLSRLQRLPIHKINYMYSSQESESVLQVTELIANHKSWTIWKQVSEWLDELCLCSQVCICSSIRKSTCSVLQCFSSFMPLEYPT